MVDEELIGEVEAAARGVDGVRRLPETEAQDLVDRLAQIFVKDRSHRWWWESLAVEPQRVAYGDTDALSALAKLLATKSEVALVITDDDDPPWPVYAGHLDQILHVLRETRFFEYFVADPDRSWIAFDTHANELVIARNTSAGGFAE